MHRDAKRLSWSSRTRIWNIFLLTNILVTTGCRKQIICDFSRIYTVRDPNNCLIRNKLVVILSVMCHGRGQQIQLPGHPGYVYVNTTRLQCSLHSPLETFVWTWLHDSELAIKILNIYKPFLSFISTAGKILTLLISSCPHGPARFLPSSPGQPQLLPASLLSLATHCPSLEDKTANQQRVIKCLSRNATSSVFHLYNF